MSAALSTYFSIDQQRLTGQEVFFAYFTEKKFVKIDFAYFPFSHLGSFKKINNLKITSIEDICINKVHAITTRKRARDYLDLYLCLKYLEWLPEDLIKNYRIKFDVNLSNEQLATSFTNVVDAQDQPIFLGQNNWDEVKDYFLKLATSLKDKVVH